MPDVKGYKYAYSAKQIGDIFAKIKETGRPDKLTVSYVQNTWLLKNAQYGAVLDILKDMKFLDNTGTPTDLYAKYQNDAYSNEAMQIGIKNLYIDLFKAYPNAYDLPKENLDGFFKQHTGAEKATIKRLYTTFNKLCSLANFKNEIADSSGSKEKEDDSNYQDKGSNGLQGIKNIPITMNIQIAIPSDATSEQYDKIFSSIKKNLIN